MSHPRIQQLTQNLTRIDNVQFNEKYSDLLQPGAYTRKILRYITGDLAKNRIHSIHGPIRKKFKRRRIIVHYPGQIIEMDLVDMQKISTKNENYKYILMCIDLFTKKLWVEPLKNKTGKITSEAIQKIFNTMENPIQTVIFDEGLEFYNQHVKKLFAQYNIHSYSIKTIKKAGAVERVNKTIKSILYKYFTDKNTRKWARVLPKIVDNYNKTYHTTIKMAPNDVTWKNHKKVFKVMFPEINVSRVCRLHVGNKVRVAKYKKEFEKAYTPNWSEEIYTITKIFQKLGVCWYQIKNSAGEIYPKYKYYYQLRKVSNE